MQAVVARMQTGGVNAFLCSRAFRIPRSYSLWTCGRRCAALAATREIRHRLSETTRKRNSARAECHDSPEAKALLDRLLRRAFDHKESSALLAVQPVNERMGW